MTDERRNEIWALLPSDYQTYVKRWYQDVIDNNEPHEHIFEGLFGFDNLTAQAEEQPKGPKFKVGDWVLFDKGMGFVLKVNHVEDIYRYFTTDINGKAYWYDENELASDPPKNIVNDHIVVAKENVNYTQYRLDLAKELAVTMIRNTYLTDSVSESAVHIANEIVRRLKETEHGDRRTD